MTQELIAVLLVVVLRFTAISGAVCNGKPINLLATESVQYVTSPNYPNNYYSNDLCRWLLITESQYEVISFRMADCEIVKSATCGSDYVATQDGQYSWSSGIKGWCGSVYNSKEYSSTGNMVLITFRTDGSLTDKGFRLEYWTVPKTYVKYLPVRQTAAHYALYGLFAVIVGSIFMSSAIIALIRNTNRFQTRLLKYIQLAPVSESNQPSNKDPPSMKESLTETNGMINPAFNGQNELGTSVAELHKRRESLYELL